MTAKKSILDRIDVREPCTESWEEMTGNDEVRFCSHCAKNVVDLSSYTRQRAEKLIRDSKGGLCVRYRKDELGRVITAPPKFTQIKRHAKIAAGVLATTMSVASMAYTQGSSRPIDQIPNAEQRDKEPNKLPGFIISGIVVDPVGAVVPNAEVTLVDKVRNARSKSQSNDDGEFSFRNFPGGSYEIEVESSGFKKAIVIGLEVSGNTHTRVVLEVGEATVGLLMIEGEPLVCEDPPKVSNEIRLQEIQTLPPSGTTFTLGLVSGVAEKPQNTKPAKKSTKKLPK